MDIEMPVLLGTDFYKNLIVKPKVIFTTAYRDYAIEGFELDAIDYLLKPITFSRFFKAIEKFIDSQNNHSTSSTNMEQGGKRHIFVTEDRKQVKISFEDILYIESIKNYIKLKTKTRNYIVKHGITSFEKLLDNRFERVHRSYIVNKDKITAYTKHDIEINEIEIPIGDRFKKLFLEKINR